jgi:ElaA protein
LAGYTRLVPPGIAYKFPSIGRVVTAPQKRSSGIGKLLMQKSIEETEKLFGKSSIRLGAQLYLKKFYESFGFKQSSDVYDEDGIDHIEMTR